MVQPAHLDAQCFVDGNNLEQKRKISLVGYVSQSCGFGSEVILQAKAARANERTNPKINPKSSKRYIPISFT